METLILIEIIIGAPIILLLVTKNILRKWGIIRFNVAGQAEYFIIGLMVSKKTATQISVIISPLPVSSYEKFQITRAGLRDIRRPQIWGTWEIPQGLYKNVKSLASHKNIIKVTSS
jgi:hypothetical protein